MPKVKFTPYIDRAVLESARAAVAALRGRVDEAYSLNALIEEALRLHVGYLERTHNGGAAFPAVEDMPGSGGRR